MRWKFMAYVLNSELTTHWHFEQNHIKRGATLKIIVYGGNDLSIRTSVSRCCCEKVILWTNNNILSFCVFTLDVVLDDSEVLGISLGDFKMHCIIWNTGIQSYRTVTVAVWFLSSLIQYFFITDPKITIILSHFPPPTTSMCSVLCKIKGTVWHHGEKILLALFMLRVSWGDWSAPTSVQ